MSDKFYKCPYCDAKFSRSAIGNHIELNHEELIPKGMTANQVGFNTVNRKTETHGCCVVCKRPTRWNEKNCKYDRLCGRPECREALREKYKKNMLKVHGKYNLLNDPDRQEKMLANRRISDTYRFTDGGRHVYTGTYERKALEFLDKVMGFHSREILSPGPVLEYEYKGQKLKWITDIVLIPFNLIIEVKDGGSNPNNREMPTYREKQVAKETMITNLGKYNYLRLTNNNFEQLLDIIAELKMQMIDDTEENRKVLIRVNEEVDMINEATFIDDPLKAYNYKDWISGKIKTLIIIGYSGAGKTTISEGLGFKFNCPVIHLDEWQYEINKKYDLPNKKVNKALYFSKMIECIENIEFKDEKKIIIEGAQISFCGAMILENRACLVVGTSILKSSLRTWKREIEMGKAGHDRLKTHFPDEPDWKITLRRLIQGPERFKTNYEKLKPFFDSFVGSAGGLEELEDPYAYEEAFIEESDGIILSPKEFKEAREFIKKACKNTDGFKWRFYDSKFNKAGRVARIDYTIPGDIGGGMESNWCDLDEFLREYVFPELHKDKKIKFIFRSVNDSEDCVDIYAMLKSNPTYPEVSIGKGDIENVDNPNEKTFKYPKSDANIESVDKDTRKSMQESQQYLDSFHEAVASKYTKNYKNLDQFCKAITSPSEVNDWYFVNKVRWFTDKEGLKRTMKRNNPDHKDIIVWPDELLQTKLGICYDHAIFMHYCCERFGIKNAILIIAATVEFPFKKELTMLGHAVTIYELPGIGWYLFNYQTNLGSVLGPYNSIEDTVKAYKNWYTVHLLRIPTNFGHKKFSLTPKIHNVYTQIHDSKEQFAVYDQFYNDKYCTQDDLFRRIPGAYDFFDKIPDERMYWFEEFIEKFDLVKKVKSLFESTELITEEVLMKDKDEKILAKIRKNREFKKFTSKMSDEDKKKVESKMLTKSNGFLSKYASTFKKNHVTEKIILSTIVGLSLASIGVAIAPITMAGVSFASDNIVDTIKKEETVIKESFGTVMMNLVYNGTNHYPEWFKPTTQFANMIIRETTKFLSKENGNFVHLSFYDPRDPCKEALDAAYYLGQYVQHLDTEENYWDSKKEQLTTTTGLFNVWIDKSDLNFTYMIIFDDDEIKKVLYVCYDTIGDRVALVPIEVPPLKTYRDEINMASRKVAATNNKTHSDQMDFILSLKGENIKLPSNSI